MSFIKDDDPNYSPEIDALACAIIVGVALVALFAHYIYR